jgi:signal transduction histidine kinase
MKIFPRTLISFAAVIAIQAILAGALISRSVERYQEEDARAELKAAAAAAFDGYNSWKLRLWRAVATLADEEAMRESSPESSGAVGEEPRLRSFADIAGRAINFADDAGAEFAVVSPRTASRSPVAFSTVTEATPLPDGRLLRYEKDHPYIEAVLLPTGLHLVGAVRLREADVFILKRIDDHLADQLGASPRVRALVLVEGGFVAGNDPGDITERVEKRPPRSIYASLPDIEADKVRWGVIVQAAGSAVDHRSPIADPASGKTQAVRIVTLLSKADFERRLDALQYAVMTATLLCAVLTILLSLALSGNIASPVRRLVAAMRRVRDGDFAVVVGGGVSEEDARSDFRLSGEIAELVAGFDEMARKLESDRLERERYIEEIEGMTVFNEELLDSLDEGVAVVASVDPVNRDSPRETAESPSFVVEKSNRSFDLLFDPEGSPSEGRPLADIAGRLDDPELAERVRLAGDASTHRAALLRLSGGKTLELKLYPLAAGPAGADGRQRCVLIAEDVSRRITYEEKIFQAEKLASVSMLSAGVAHEINNPLSSILSNAQNLIEEESDTEKAESLKLIEQETRRIARIVRELLDFSSPRPLATEGSDANEAVRSTLRLMGYSLGKAALVRIDSTLDPELPRVTLAEDELKQVLINLLTNSLQAIEGEGIVSVQTARTVAGNAELLVSDTGRGIDRDALPRIFDPFYTTKRDGTGLGLSVVYGIVARAGGTIRAESEKGQGTTMRLELPSAQEKA